MEGKTIHGYILQRRLGVGGMAEVWYAENKIHKPAAVKILNRDLSLNETIVARFQNEAEIMVALNHPNIRQVYDYSEIDGRPVIIMEYLEGDDLKARMKQGQRFTDDELKKWWNQLVDALNYTHKKGVIHRDIKPGNIFIDNDGNIKLLDFGIAKVRESISSTQTGQKLGTLMYMSPEQVKDSKHIDYHTDIYSLAVTFVHLLTGKKPYDSDTVSDFEIQTSIVNKPLDLNGISSDWQELLEPCLDKDPLKRPDLRYIESSKNKKADKKQTANNDEATIVDGMNDSEDKKVGDDKKEGKRNKAGLWIALVVLELIAIVVIMMLKNTSSQPQVDYDDEAYMACHSIDDFRAYIDKYGTASKHYSNAVGFVENYKADSAQKAELTQNIELMKANEKTDVPSVAIISPTKLMLLYEDVKNPVNISVPGKKSNEITINVEGGKYTKGKNQNEYLVEVNNGAKLVIIKVLAKDSNNKNVTVGEQTFRVKKVPAPTVKIGDINGGKVSKEELLAVGRMMVVMKDFDYEGFGYTIDSYAVSTYKGTFIDKFNRGAKFSDDVINLISNAQPGQRIQFQDICVKSTKGDITNVGSIVVQIR